LYKSENKLNKNSKKSNFRSKEQINNVRSLRK
jgi:hypothetical protein